MKMILLVTNAALCSIQFSINVFEQRTYLSFIHLFFNWYLLGYFNDAAYGTYVVGIICSVVTMTFLLYTI